MKKLLITLSVIFGLFMFGILCSDAADFTLPQCAITPTVDGKISKNEWYGAYHTTFTPDNGKWDKVVWNQGVIKDEACPSYDIYAFWYNDPNEDGTLMDVQTGGLYFCVVAPDKTRGQDPGTGAYNAADVLQFLCDPNYSRRSDFERTYCYDFAPCASNGRANFYEHYQFQTKPSGISLEVVSTVTTDGYTMEIFVPWLALNIKDRLPAHKIGTKMGMGFVVMDFIGASFYYYAYDFGDGKALENCSANAKTLNTVTFGETVYPPGYVSTGNVDKIKTLIASSEGLTADKALYTAASYKLFEQALAKAKTMTIDNKQNEIDAAYTLLDNAVKGLAKAADLSVYEQLQSTITAVETLVEADYEAESWTALQTALVEAKKITDKSSEADISAANTALTIAVDSLLAVGAVREESDISGLKTLFNRIDTLKEADYTPESWSEMMTLVDEAKQLTTEDSQFEIDDMYDKISAAKEALVSATGEKPVDTEPTDDSPSDNGWIIWVAVAAVVVAAAVVAVIILLKKKKTK